MIKSKARSEQFFTRSGSYSTVGSRKGFGLLNHGDNPVSVLSEDEKRASLVHKLAALEKARLNTDSKKLDAELLVKVRELQSVLGSVPSIKSKMRGVANVSQIFVDICRERMTNPQFKAILKEASEIALKMQKETPP